MRTVVTKSVVSVTLDKFDTIQLKRVLEDCQSRFCADEARRSDIEQWINRLRAAIYYTESEK